jgi:hypothetical protein
VIGEELEFAFGSRRDDLPFGHPTMPSEPPVRAPLEFPSRWAGVSGARDTDVKGKLEVTQGYIKVAQVPAVSASAFPPDVFRRPLLGCGYVRAAGGSPPSSYPGALPAPGTELPPASSRVSTACYEVPSKEREQVLGVRGRRVVDTYNCHRNEPALVFDMKRRPFLRLMGGWWTRSALSILRFFMDTRRAGVSSVPPMGAQNGRVCNSLRHRWWTRSTKAITSFTEKARAYP